MAARILSSRYSDKLLVNELVQRNRHRHLVGGLWEEIGCLQLEALKRHGLKPGDAVLDAACGSLRGGHLIVDYVEAGNYFGFDLNEPLLEAGYEFELTSAQQSKLPRNQLMVGDVTKPLPFKRSFQFALAFSLFTHLPPDSVRAGLGTLSSALTAEGKLLATFFIVPDESIQTFEHLDGIVSHSDKDPYHVTLAELSLIAESKGLSAELDEFFKHPRGQSLVKFTKLPR